MMTMPRNGEIGLADRPPIQLGHFLKQKQTVIINGEPHQAWVTGAHAYPRRLMARLDRALWRYRRVAEPLLAPMPSTEELASMAPGDRAELLRVRQEAVDNHDEAYHEYVTESLMTLIPTLDEETAEVIPLEVAKQLLIDLGYFEPPQEPPDDAGRQEVAEHDPLIGATSPPDSAVSTDSPPSSS